MGAISPRLEQWLAAYEQGSDDGGTWSVGGFGNDGTVAITVTVESGYASHVASVLRLAGARHVRELPRKGQVEAEATPRAIHAVAHNQEVTFVDTTRAVIPI
jgi:hypothetical protein